MLGRYDRKNYNAWIKWSQYIGEELIGKEMDVNYNEWELCYMKRVDGSCQGIGIG
jgi:hypothetical protein